MKYSLDLKIQLWIHVSQMRSHFGAGRFHSLSSHVAVWGKKPRRGVREFILFSVHSISIQGQREIEMAKK